MAMTKIEVNDGSVHINPDGNMVALNDFVRETTEEDGAYLMVVDEASDKIVKYCVAFKGRWRDTN